MYAKIREYYPNEHYHEVPNSNTPEEEPAGWEIPIGKLVSNKEAEEAEKQSNEAEIRAKEAAKEAKKQAKETKKQANSKKKSSNQE